MRTVPALVAMSSARTGTGQSPCRTRSYTARNRAQAASLENPGMRGDLAIPSFSRRRTAPARIEVAHRPVLRPTLVAHPGLRLLPTALTVPGAALRNRSGASVRSHRTGIGCRDVAALLRRLDRKGGNPKRPTEGHPATAGGHRCP